MILGFFGLLFLAAFFRVALHSDQGGTIGWALRVAIFLAVLRVLFTVVVSGLTPTPPTPSAVGQPQRKRISAGASPLPPLSPAAVVRERIERLGGGAYLGVSQSGDWAVADCESAVMVIGPPRSGKTTAVIIPSVMAASGAVISTSTKPEVMEATLAARSEVGQVWLFDPAATEHDLPAEVRPLSWSPVAASATWDEALVTARAMTACSRVGAGTTNENHWTERAAALLAPLLYAASLSAQPIEEVLRWTLRQDLAPALKALTSAPSEIAADVLLGIERTDTRERSSIFSASAGVLSAYNSDAVRASAATPNFDPMHFAASSDTIYITAPEHKQALCAPLIVGLLEQIRHAVYQLAARGEMPGLMQWFLDELPNIAPIHDLPALVSQAGGQSLHIVAGFQDLSQARTRWGTDAADGFLSLFQTKLILNGIGDSRTLEAISLALGEYDRDTVSQSLGRSDPQEFLSAPTHSDTVGYQTQRQRVLTPGEIGRLPDRQALLLRGNDWETVQLTEWYRHEPWSTVAQAFQPPPPRSAVIPSAEPDFIQKVK
jgi:type IV secretion system protein VirD4